MLSAGERIGRAAAWAAAGAASGEAGVAPCPSEEAAARLDDPNETSTGVGPSTTPAALPLTVGLSASILDDDDDKDDDASSSCDDCEELVIGSATVGGDEDVGDIGDGCPGMCTELCGCAAGCADEDSSGGDMLRISCGCSGIGRPKEDQVRSRGGGGKVARDGGVDSGAADGGDTEGVGESGI